MSLLDDVLHPLRSRETRAAKSAASKAAVGPDDLSGFKAGKGLNADAYDGTIRDMAKKYAVPARLIKSVISAESSFDPNIRSSVGAHGLMQLMPGTARDLGVRDTSNPVQNIEGGTKYLASLLNRFNGDVTKAVAAYNAGPGNVAKYHGVPPFRETQNYVAKVLGTYNGSRTVDVAPLQTVARSNAASYAGKGPWVPRESYLYVPPSYDRYTPMVGVSGLTLKELLAALQELLGDMGISVPPDVLLQMLEQANPALEGIEKLQPADQQRLLSDLGGIVVPPPNKFPDQFGGASASSAKRPDFPLGSLSPGEQARFDAARVKGLEAAEKAAKRARHEMRENAAMARALGLPPATPWEQVQARMTDSARKQTAIDMGLPPQASWSEIKNVLEGRERARIAEALGLKPDAGWSEIDAKEDELRQMTA